MVLGSRVESREAATTDVVAIDHYVTCGGFRDAYELLLVFTSKLHKLLSSNRLLLHRTSLRQTGTWGRLRQLQVVPRRCDGQRQGA